ncbi:MAG: zinc finger CCHC domain-containing protein, partial [Gaiellaceae bacterium]
VQGGLTEADDLIFIDNDAITAFDITPISKSVLRNYVVWRDDNVTAYKDISDYINVTKGDLINARRRRERGDIDVTARKKESGYDMALFNNLQRQSILLGQQSSAIKDMAEATAKKHEKPFVETFKANSECPKFSGKDKHWSNFKRQFKAYLGAHGLLHLLKTKVTDMNKKDYDRKYDEKNAWLHHTLMNHVGRVALSYTTVQKDDDGEVIPNGQKLWSDISDWYEGDNNKASMARMARAKLQTTFLKNNQDMGTYLSMMDEQFQLLEDSGDMMSSRQQVEYLCRNIKDTKYTMECSIIKSDLNIDLEEAKRKLHRLELESKEPDLSVEVRANKSDARGRAGGRSTERGRARGRGRSRGRGRGRNNDKNDDSKTKWNPKCYECGKLGHLSYQCPDKDNDSTAIVAVAAASHDSDDESDNDSSRKRSRVSFIGAGNIVQVCLPVSRVNLSTHSPNDDNISKLISDSAANISVLGNNWYLVEKSLRTIDIVGFAEDLERKNLPIVNAVTKTYSPEGKALLLQVNEAAYLGTGDSLLSKIQVGSYGIQVDDDPYFGSGYIISNDNGIDLPLTIESGLIFLPIERPTEDDLEKLSVFTLTSDLPWDPTNLSIPCGFAQAIKGKIQNNDDELIMQLAPRLGMTNLDIVKKTLQCTTWMGRLDPRVPLRRHIKARLPHMGLV